MKSHMYFLMALLFLIGCSSGQKTTGGDQTAGVEKKSADDGSAKKEDKRKEEQMAKEDLEKKRSDNEKSKMELKAVKNRLRNMGLAVTFDNMTRESNVFRYSDGHTIVVKDSVTDQGVLVPLNELLSKQKEKDRGIQDASSVCSGGFEACLAGRLYIYYMVHNQNGACVGAWYLTDQECKP